MQKHVEEGPIMEILSRYNFRKKNVAIVNPNTVGTVTLARKISCCIDTVDRIHAHIQQKFMYIFFTAKSVDIQFDMK
jgi:hypothetical protein